MESDDFPPQGMELRTVQTLATAPNLGYKDGCHSVTATATDTPDGASTPRSAFSPRSDDSALASPAPSTPLASLHSPGDHFTPVNVGPEGWYLITGGVSGLGLQTALALVRHGARRLILTSRGGTIPERYQEDYDALLSMSPDLDVRVEACDAGSLDSVLQLFHSVSSDGGIAGVVHSAGVLVDGNIRTQDVERLRAVWPGKVQGAVNLHVASVRQVEQGGPPLRLFLLYSSSAALFGSAAGSNYAAANSMLDNLAILRRQEGLACTSIQWGPWNAVSILLHNLPAFVAWRYCRAF
jgi:NADP-dependent 3-hydroxy acid dehydrogenase YdfG